MLPLVPTEPSTKRMGKVQRNTQPGEEAHIYLSNINQYLWKHVDYSYLVTFSKYIRYYEKVDPCGFLSDVTSKK